MSTSYSFVLLSFYVYKYMLISHYVVLLCCITVMILFGVLWHDRCGMELIIFHVLFHTYIWPSTLLPFYLGGGQVGERGREARGSCCSFTWHTLTLVSVSASGEKTILLQICHIHYTQAWTNPKYKWWQSNQPGKLSIKWGPWMNNSTF